MADSLADLIVARTPSAGAELLTGLVSDVADDTGAVTMRIAGTDVLSVPVLASYVPAVGDSVAVLRQGQRLLALGAVATPQAAQGTVVSATTTAVVVSTPLGTKPYPYLASYTPTAGDTVAILWTGTQGVVAGRLSAPIAKAAHPGVPAAEGVPPASVSTSGTSTFVATSAASWLGTALRTDSDDVVQGTGPSDTDASSGAYFYGASPVATLAGATVTGCRVYLIREDAGAPGPLTAHVQAHSSTEYQASPVVYTGAAVDVPLEVGQGGWVTLPVAMGQALASGGGLGISGATPYLRLSGPATQGAAGALSIDWRR